jgi:hypothetical protein
MEEELFVRGILFLFSSRGIRKFVFSPTKLLGEWIIILRQQLCGLLGW